MRADEAEWAIEDLKRQGFDRAYREKVANHDHGYAVVMHTGDEPNRKTRRFFDRDQVKAFLRGVA
jgi:hypothetical protein